MNLPRVLVIDDSISTCFLISATLQRMGCEVDVAVNGREGMAKIRTFRPHCLIVDVLLPDISGYSLCRHLRQNAFTEKLPLIFISSKSASLDINYGLRQGANRYLPKPFTADKLIQSVWEVIPASLRTYIHPAMPASQPQDPSPALLKLVPHRTLGHDAMQTSNPLARVPPIRDKQARRLFAEIDGKKSVNTLAASTGLDTDEVIRALRVLLNAKSISLYDEAGQVVEEQAVR